VWVRSVASGSPADKAGIEAGDIIYQLEEEVLAIDGTMRDYCDILRSRQSSDTMNVTVIRFSDLSLLKGQLNGDKLEVIGTFIEDGGSSNNNNNQMALPVNTFLSPTIPARSRWISLASGLRSTVKYGGLIGVA
jgi:hypothetical protein